MSDSPATQRETTTGPEFETAENEGSDTSVARVLAAIAAGSLLTGALAWLVIELGDLSIGMQAGVGLGVAVGGGLGAVAYLVADPGGAESGRATTSAGTDNGHATTSAGADTAPSGGRSTSASPDERVAPGTPGESTAEPEGGTDRASTAARSAAPARDSTGSTSTADFFELSPHPVLSFAGEGDDLQVTDANAAFERTFGVSASTLAETPLGEATMTPDLGDVAGRVAAGDAVDERVTCETVDGTAPFHLQTVTGSGDTAGIRGYLVYMPAGDGRIDDGSETDAADDGAEAETADDRVAELASVVSHELHNPLNSARTRIQAARETGEDEHLETALRNLDRTFRIIDDLTTLARGGALVDGRADVSLDDAVAAAWETVDADHATLSVADDLGTVSADASALEHLLENLFRNAAEHAATDEGVAVEVGRLARGGFYVADDGPGIPPDRREEVFEAGYTTDRDGTGLGLNIVERVAEAHGWTVTVTDSEEGGARFEIAGLDLDP